MYSMNAQVSVSFIERLHALQAAVIVLLPPPPPLLRAFAWLIKPIVTPKLCDILKRNKYGSLAHAFGAKNQKNSTTRKVKGFLKQIYTY